MAWRQKKGHEEEGQGLAKSSNTTSTQDLGPLYPVKSSTTLCALSTPRLHTEGHFARIFPNEVTVRTRVSDRADANGLAEGRVMLSRHQLRSSNCTVPYALHCTVRTVDPSVQLLSDPLSVF
jgi:hypothetical protein